MEPLAEHIRSHAQISGLTIDTIQHKIGLYTYDILIFLMNPAQSLQPLWTLLVHFGLVSLYKLNHSKSHMLSIGLPPPLKNQITNIDPFWWVPLGTLSYLGIQLTSPSSKIRPLNLSILINKLTKLCMNLKSGVASWAGRISLTKMFLLLHIFYLFHTLPLPYSPTQLRKLHNILQTFTYLEFLGYKKRSWICQRNLQA